MFYNPSTARTYTLKQIEQQTGLDPAVTAVEVYIDMGFYPVTENAPTLPDCLYTLTAVYTITGNAAVQSWTGVAVSLADGKTHGLSCVKKAADEYVTANFNASGFNTPLLVAAMSIDSASRGPTFAATVDAMAAKTNILQDQINAVNAAVDVAEITYVAFPATAITGTLTLTRSGNDLTVGELSSLVGATGPDFELVLPNATIQWDAGSSSFPASAAAWSGTYTFTLRYGGFYDVLTGTTGTGEVAHAINWTPPITPLPLTHSPSY